MTDIDKGFIRGAMWAIALLQRNGGMDPDQVLHESGLTKAHAIEAGVDGYDMEPLAKLWPVAPKTAAEPDERDETSEEEGEE